METSFVYQNERSLKVILLSILGPMIPLFLYLILFAFIEIERMYVIVAILYLCFWAAVFMLVMMNIFEVMVVYKDRMVFINPFKERVIPLSSIKMIYYNKGRGITFTMKDEKTLKLGFIFKYDSYTMEELFRRLAGFIDFTEEHIPESSIYCLVSN